MSDVLDLRQAGLGLLVHKAVSGADLREALLPDDVPVVRNINSAILAATASRKCRVDMHEWHGEFSTAEPERKCSTVHCLAGWAVHLAGEAGYALEERLNTPCAAALIFAASDRNHPVPDFYLDEVDSGQRNRHAKNELRRRAKAEVAVP